jgi:PKD repeat protein
MLSPSGSVEEYPNSVPSITSLASSFEGTKDVPITFTASATDSSTLQYQWYFGDGSVSGWLSSPTTTHPYAQDGYYNAYFAARETTAAPSGAEDYFISSQGTSVKVIDISNTAPYGLSISYSPTSFDSGDVVTFTGTASDDNVGDTLYYSWSFGDTYTASGQVVTHQFKTPGAYTVTLSVDDMHVGTQPRPVTTTQMVSVAPNLPPTVSVPDYTGIPWKQPYTYTVTASDPELDALRYTWDWDDGSMSVTTSNTATHTYTIKTTYTLTVCVDDLTGLYGHNVSDFGSVQVVGANKAPSITSFTVDNNVPYTGQTVTFTGSAKDLDGDPLAFTFEFGDGTSEVYYVTPPAGVDATFVVPHVYTTAGTKTAYLHVFDGTTTKTSTGLTITVIANYEPIVTPLEDVSGITGVEMTFTCDAFDSDFDELTYTWDFGDGTPLVVGNPVVHTYSVADVYAYSVYVDDGHYHNVSSSAVATISPPVSYGLLRVTTNPAVPGMIYLNGDWMSRWGLDWVKLDQGHTRSRSAMCWDSLPRQMPRSS